MEMNIIQALGNAQFFLRGKICLLALRAVPQGCIVNQYFIFHRPLS